MFPFLFIGSHLNLAEANYLAFPPNAPNRIARTIPAAITTTMMGSQVVARVPKAVITDPVALEAAVVTPPVAREAVWKDARIINPAPIRTPTRTKARTAGNN